MIENKNNLIQKIPVMVAPFISRMPWKEPTIALAVVISAANLKKSSIACDRKDDHPPIGSFSPSPPLYYFNPNPNLEICFDARTRTPVYVMEKLFPGNQQNVALPRRPHFIEEASLPEIFRSRNSHYRHSGYDRGHMAPAADLGVDTFVLTNACPQHPNLNRKLWNRLENWIRRVVQRLDSKMMAVVLTGPVWLPTLKVKDQDIWEYRYVALGKAPSLLLVPTHFFKLVVILDEKHQIREYAAFCVPNYQGDSEEPQLEQYLVRWTDLEAVVGMHFFPQLISQSDEWRALADNATEVVWKESRKVLLLESESTKKSMKGIAKQRLNQGPQHLCRKGICN
jgi:endonuclease G, mitochondrial